MLMELVLTLILFYILLIFFAEMNHRSTLILVRIFLNEVKFPTDYGTNRKVRK